METAELVEAVALRLGMAMPYLMQDKLDNTEAVRHVGVVTWREASAIWTRIKPFMDSRPDLRRAADKLAAKPGPEALAAFQVILTDLLSTQSQLRADVYDLIVYHGETPAAELARARPIGSVNVMYAVRVIVLAIMSEALARGFIAATPTVSGKPSVVTLLAMLAGLMLGVAALTYLGHSRGLPKPLLLGLSSIFPGAFLMGGFSLIFYRRADSSLKLAGGALTSGSRWMVLPLLVPPVMFGALAIINFSYIQQFSLNTFGMMIFVALITSYLLAGVALWYGFWLRRATNSLRLGIVSAVSGLCLTFAFWAIMLGPAGAQAFELFRSQ